MNSVRVGLVLVLGAISTTCTTTELETLRTTIPRGTAFTKALSQEYLELANLEREEMQDRDDQRFFARKGLRAAYGEIIMPERIDDWPIPEDWTTELKQARMRLLSVLEGSGRHRAPGAAAKAQAKFDCWLNGATETRRLARIKACRTAFAEALAALEEKVSPSPAVHPSPSQAPFLTPRTNDEPDFQNGTEAL